jgi:hypothetical protein
VPEAKTQKTKASVSEFLKAIPDDRRRRDAKTVAGLMKEVTKAKPAMWGSSIVGFGSYKLTYANGRVADWPVVAFSPRKAALVLYILRGFDEYDDLAAKVGKLKRTNGCLYVKSMDDIDATALKTLIKKSVANIRAKES